MPKLTIEYSINGRFLESRAGAVILPGMLLKYDQSGNVIPHSSLDGIAYPLIAMEDRLAGKSITEVYEVGSNVHCRYCLPGDVFMGLAQGVIEKGMFLSSAANGKLKEIPSGILADTTIIGQALASSGTEETYTYFAINGLSLDEVYGQAEGFYYALDHQIITLDDFIPVEVM